MALAESSSVERVEVEYFGRIAERDTRLLTIAVLNGILAGRTEEDVNFVNAPAIAEERGITISETKQAQARDYTDLVRVTLVCGENCRERVVGTTLGRLHRPHLLEAWGQRFNLQLEPGHPLTLFKYVDQPGMIGRVGSMFGEHGLNINAAAVGRNPLGDDEDGRPGEVAVMAVTTDNRVPKDVVQAIAASDGFLAGRGVSL
jgi:D-3-phosphoglycerate dehydrogenase